MPHIRESKIKAHYHSDNLMQKIQSALEKAGKDLSRLELKDLSPEERIKALKERRQILARSSRVRV